MLAHEIMTRNPTVVTPEESISRVASIMRDLDIGIVPVVASRSTNMLEGVITDRDIVVRCVAMQHEPSCRVGDHMTADHIDTVLPTTDVDEVIRLMEEDRVRRIVVVDDMKEVVGIIAQADLALKLGPKQPRVVEEVLERISEPAHAMP
jgi:CBS domain-containing protein